MTPIADDIEARAKMTEDGLVLDPKDAARLLGVFRLVEELAVTGQQLQAGKRAATRAGPHGPLGPGQRGLVDPRLEAEVHRVAERLAALMIPLFMGNVHAVDNVLNPPRQEIPR